MLQAMRKRMKDDEGFTLIELMVVVLIIAILIAIAIPTFLGLRTRAQDRAAQSDLRNALTAAKAYFTDNQVYTGFDAAALNDTEPSLQGVGAAVASTVDPPRISIAVSTDGSIVGLARLSASGTCWHVTDGQAFGTVRNSDTPCTGNQALTYTASDGSW